VGDFLSLEIEACGDLKMAVDLFAHQ
jgi:hypothetical protein